jgi:hypothetical protein
MNKPMPDPPLNEQYSVHNPKGIRPDQPLNAQQMQALAKQHADALIAIKRDVDLRKWAVDQACGLAGAAYEAEAQAVEVVSVARKIHDFLTESASQTT